MIKVNLFQNDKEPYFWTTTEIEKIIRDTQIVWEDNVKINIDDIEFNIRKYEKYNEVYDDDCLNVLILNFTGNYDSFKSTFDKHKDKKFLFVIKTIENYSHLYEIQQELFVNYISSSDNIKVLWDSSEVSHKNFIFDRKVHLQNYYNNNNFFPSDLFLFGQDLFYNEKNKKRLGLHFNKGYHVFRQTLINSLTEHENFNLTINTENHYNKKIQTNYKSQIFDCNENTSVFPTYKYFDSFLNLNLKSEIELVYETFTMSSSTLDFIKFTEKTIKLLYLGKPFLHTDPVAHNLLKINGLQTYDSLLSTELLDIYNNTNTKILLDKSDYYWLNALCRNISWICNMQSDEWQDRLDIANKIAKDNRDIILETLYKKTLRNYIKNYNNL